MKRYDFISFDGKRISVCEWGGVENPKGIIQISHGMAEHAGRYDIFARYMNERGYIVFADDHRAHGQTDKQTPGWCEGDIYNDTLKDMALLTEKYKGEYGLPLILLGHSYGSFLAQRYIQEYGGKIDGAVIGGSSYMKVFTTGFGSFVSGLVCAFGGGKKPSNLLNKASFEAYNKKLGGESFISSVKEECDRYYADEDCAFVCSYNFYKRFLGGVLKAYKKENLLKTDKNLPILLIAGENDPVGEMGKGVEKLEALYKSYGLNVRKILYKGVRHEYFNDTSREKAFSDVASFADECAGK